MVEISISIGNKCFGGEHNIIALKQQLLGIILCFFYAFKVAMAILFLCKKCCRSNNPVNISYFNLIKMKNLSFQVNFGLHLPLNILKTLFTYISTIKVIFCPSSSVLAKDVFYKTFKNIVVSALKVA